MSDLRNVTAKNIKEEVWNVLQDIREENNFKNHHDVLELLTEHYLATKGKKAAKPEPKPAPSPAGKPQKGKGYFAVKLSERDEAPLKRVKDWFFEQKNLESDSQILRFFLRQQLSLIAQKTHVVKLPEVTNDKVMAHFEKWRKRGRYRDTTDAFHFIVKEAIDYDIL